MSARALLGGVLGWMTDVYDLTLVLFVASLLGELFFPKASQLAQLLFVFSSYSLTLLARPLGGFIFGHFADKLGRRGIMVITLLGLGISTAATGALPTYQEWGIAATALFVLLRLLVGVFVGGEISGSHLIAIEAAPARRRGLFSGVLQSGYYWGYSLAALTYSSLVGLFGPKAFTAYVWRYAFLIGLVVAVVGLLLRLTVPESELFNRTRQRGEIAKVPAAVLLKEYGADFWRALLVMSGLYWVAYATLGYLPTYLGSILHMPRGAAFNAMFYAALIGGVLTALGGALSDYVGRRRAFMIAGLLGIAAAYPLVLSLRGELAATAVAAGLLVGIVGMGGGVMLAFIAELFPTRVRGSAVGLLWNMANIGSTIALLASPAVTLLYSPALGYSALLVVGYSLAIAGALISRDATGSELK